MKSITFAKLAAGLAATCAQWSRDTADMVEMGFDEAELATVLRFTNEMRERLLWIERRAADIADAAATTTVAP